MPKPKKLHDWQKQNGRKPPTSEKTEEAWVRTQSCMICSKAELKGAYGSHGDGWTCSKVCNDIQDAKEKYPGHSAAAFELKHGL